MQILTSFILILDSDSSKHNTASTTKRPFSTTRTTTIILPTTTTKPTTTTTRTSKPSSIPYQAVTVPTPFTLSEELLAPYLKPSAPYYNKLDPNCGKVKVGRQNIVGGSKVSQPGLFPWYD